MQVFCLLVWSLRRDRNYRVHNSKTSTSIEIMESTSRFLVFFQSCRAADKVRARHSIGSSVRWSPPPGEDLKLNVDIVVLRAAGFFGVGAIIRDAQGVERARLAKTILEAHSPFVAECLALREGLEFA